MRAPTLLRLASLLSLSGVTACAVTTTSTPADASLSQDVPSDAPGPDDAGPLDAPREDRPTADVPLVFEDLPVDHPAVDAGTCVINAPVAPSVCPATTCGNGVRDSCVRCRPCGPGGGGPGRPDGGGPPPPWDAGTCCDEVTETCDGTDLGGATCETLGYRGGGLRCDGACGRDTRACDACAPTEARGRCGRAPVESLDAQSLALAVNGGRVALAWVEGSAHLGVAVLDQDLNVLRATTCAGYPGARLVALTHTGAGFLLAVETLAGVHLQPLRSDGTLAPQGATIASASVPLLAPGPSGGALLVYSTFERDGATVRAVRASAEGAVTRTQATVFRGATETEYGSAAFTDDGWLVAMRVRGVEVARVNLDLTVGPAHRPAGEDTEYPQVAWDGARAAVTWSSFGDSISVRMAELGRDGARVGPERTFSSLLSSSRYFNVAPLARVGADLAVLVGTHTGQTGHSGRIDLVRENAQPLMRVTTPRPVTQSPEAVTSYRVAGLENTAVVAWIGVGTPRRIGLARLTP